MTEDTTPQTEPAAEEAAPTHADTPEIEGDEAAAEEGSAPEVTPEEAIAIYTAALEVNPEDALAYFNRGNAYYNAEQFEAAIDDYRQAAKIDPSMAEAHSQRGYALFGLGNHKAALDAFTMYSKQVPDDPVGYNNQAFLYLVQGRTSRAESAWTKATASENAPDYAYAGHALALYRLKKRRAAAEQYAKAIELNPLWREDVAAAAEQVSWSEQMVEEAHAILRLLDAEQTDRAES